MLQPLCCLLKGELMLIWFVVSYVLFAIALFCFLLALDSGESSVFAAPIFGLIFFIIGLAIFKSATHAELTCTLMGNYVTLSDASCVSQTAVN